MPQLTHAMHPAHSQASRLVRCRGASNVGILVAWAGQELGKQVAEARLRLGEHPDSPSTCAALESALKRLLAALNQGELPGMLSFCTACDRACLRLGQSQHLHSPGVSQAPAGCLPSGHAPFQAELQVSEQSFGVSISS